MVKKSEGVLREPNLFLFFVHLLGWPERTWSETDDESQSEDGQSLEGDLAPTNFRVIEGLFNYELKLFTAEINLFVEVALEFIDRDDYAGFNICAYITENNLTGVCLIEERLHEATVDIL